MMVTKVQKYTLTWMNILLLLILEKSLFGTIAKEAVDSAFFFKKKKRKKS